MSKNPLVTFMLGLGVRVPDNGCSEGALFSLLYETTDRDWPQAKESWKTGGWAALALIFGVQVSLITQTRLPDALMGRTKETKRRTVATAPRASIRGEETSPNPWLCKNQREEFLPDGEAYLKVAIHRSAGDSYRVYDDLLDSAFVENLGPSIVTTVPFS